MLFRSHGLIYLSGPANDGVCATMQFAAGMVLQVFSTGRGTPYGLASAPIIKVSSNSALYSNWKDIIDIDAGVIASGNASIVDVGQQIFNFILDVASGRQQCWTEKHKLYNKLHIFNPAPLT